MIDTLAPVDVDRAMLMIEVSRFGCVDLPLIFLKTQVPFGNNTRDGVYAAPRR
jgi:hypothetical protein